MMTLCQKSYYSDCPWGVDRMWVMRLFWGFFQPWLGLEKERLWFFFFSFIHKILVELLLSASDATGRPSTPVGGHGGGEASGLQALGGS